MKILIIVLALIAMLLGYLMAAKEAGGEELPDIRIYSIHKVMDVWGGKQWSYFNNIVEAESHWDYLAKNPKSSAQGLCQAMLSIHDVPEDYKTNPYTQIDWCVNYISERYDSPKEAWRFWSKHNWF